MTDGEDGVDRLGPWLHNIQVSEFMRGLYNGTSILWTPLTVLILEVSLIQG